MKDGLIEQLKTQEYFFMNTISCFTEEDSGFKPKDEMYTVAQHIGHAAETVNWFLEGAFGNKGFDMNFENYEEKMKKYSSFNECKQQFTDAVARGIERIKEAPDEELTAPITAEIMKGAPKMAVVGAIADHSAHHRGSLAVYARLAGKTPKMPYGEM
ncbi:MAG: DinB family protein [Candidatus Cloacimonetes bacterium]|nr:DinB family protein [Candidatus Cloacimonadota bacterium]MCF8393996.1 DinB family protein [Melioribacteraceae bacterium]